MTGQQLWEEVTKSGLDGNKRMLDIKEWLRPFMTIDVPESLVMHVREEMHRISKEDKVKTGGQSAKSFLPPPPPVVPGSASSGLPRPGGKISSEVDELERRVDLLEKEFNEISSKSKIPSSPVPAVQSAPHAKTQGANDAVQKTSGIGSSVPKKATNSALPPRPPLPPPTASAPVSGTKITFPETARLNSQKGPVPGGSDSPSGNSASQENVQSAEVVQKVTEDKKKVEQVLSELRQLNPEKSQ